MKTQKSLIESLLQEVTDASGNAAVDRYPSLRHVDAKVREFGLVLDALPASAASIKERFRKDDDFQANSRRVRLEAVANYCRTVLRFLTSGILDTERKPIAGPSLARLTASVPTLEEVIQRRWLESQVCWFAGAHLASVVLMGSILEALLLSRVLLSPADAGRASQVPRDRSGAPLKFQDWKLSHLIEVAVELKWLKLDRGKFSHSLRESRNIVHPYSQATSGADFDEGTCRTCWQVLNAACEDLLSSL
jgi:hypothetical protein